MNHSIIYVVNKCKRNYITSRYCSEATCFNFYNWRSLDFYFSYFLLWNTQIYTKSQFHLKTNLLPQVQNLHTQKKSPTFSFLSPSPPQAPTILITVSSFDIDTIVILSPACLSLLLKRTSMYTITYIHTYINIMCVYYKIILW